MGETRVDLRHLLEDLRDAYVGPLEETILTEVLANGLDSGASRIRLSTDPVGAALTIVDDGRGMRRRELARYHDIAASTKARGESIGFAGVGIKLGLLAAQEVVTETRRGASHVATRWHLASRHRAPWRWIPPAGMTSERGTAVRLILTNPLSPLLDAGYLEETIRRHFEPLLDGAFEELLRRHYAAGLAFEVDGRPVIRAEVSRSGRVPVAIRLGRRRTPSAVGYLERRPDGSSGPDGIAISTFGKVIKRGWDWLGLGPTAAANVVGVIEAPDLAGCLTLNKNDFIRSGARGATYLAYRKAIQEVVARQLATWGDTRDGEVKPRVARLDRELERVLEDLAENFPLLRSLVDRRAGGQRRLPMPGRGSEGAPAPLFSNLAAAGATEGAPTDPPEPAHSSDQTGGSGDGRRLPDLDGAAPNETAVLGQTAAADSGGGMAGRRRPARYGLMVQFESRPSDPELGRLVDSTIWINDSHPAFTRAASSRSLGYHTALVVALTLAPLAVETPVEHAFITQFLAQWGSARKPRQGG